jgi:hypothetical protein
VEGVLRDVRSESISLQIPNGLLTFDRKRLADSTRRLLFRGDFARHHATRRVQIERDERLQDTNDAAVPVHEYL